MADKKNKIREGQLFAVPIGDGLAIGLIARYFDYKILAYFFNRLYNKVPVAIEAEINVNSVIYVVISSSLALDKGLWTIIGDIDGWEKKRWPVPVFYRVNSIDDGIYRVYYDDNLDAVKREFVSDLNSIEGLPNDGLAGYGFVEKRLKRIFENLSNSAK